MAFNGSGVFTLAAGNPVVTGTTISSTWANTTLSDIATGLSTTITKDGQTTPTANISMGGFKITNVGTATVSTDGVPLGQLGSVAQAQTGTFFTTGGTTTAYTLTPTPAITSLIAGQRFNVKFNASNTSTSPTLAISGLAATAIKIYDAAGAKTNPPVGGLALDMLADVEYDGTDYVVYGPIPTTLVWTSGNQTVAGIKTLTSQPVLPVNVELWLNTSNGHGSTNGAIRRMLNVVSNTGAAYWTYADSATLGGSITFVKACTVGISYGDQFSTTSAHGLSLNSAQLTTAITAITLANRLAVVTDSAGGAPNIAPVTKHFAVGDVLRMHTNGTADGTPALSQFIMTLINETA